MTRYTHGEIERAKMLSRRVSAFQNFSAPPLSRAKAATTLLLAVIWCVIWQRARALSRWLRDRSVCPQCAGRRQQLTHIVHDEFEMRPCRLCEGKGEVTWRKVESYKWGQAAQRYRLAANLSLAKAYYICGLTPDDILRHERGLVPLDDWPDSLRELADLQLDREAAGHVSTT